MFLTSHNHPPPMFLAVLRIFGRRRPAEIRPVIVVSGAIAVRDLMARTRWRAEESKRDKPMDKNIAGDAALGKPDGHIAEAIPSLPQDHSRRVVAE